MLCWRYAALHLHLTKRLKQRAGCFILSLRNEMPDVTKLPEIRNPSDSWKFPGNVLKLIYFYLLTDGKMVITMKVWLLTSLFYLFPVLILLSAFMKDVDMWTSSISLSSLADSPEKMTMFSWRTQTGWRKLTCSLCSVWNWLSVDNNTLYIDSILCPHVLFFTSWPVKLMNRHTLPFLSNSITCSSCRSIRGAVC